MFENITNFFKKFNKKDNKSSVNSKDAAKERLHLVLMQDRANVSADFLELMKQEIIEVIKKYIDVDENAIDVRLTNKENADGTNGAPALYANIPILNIKNETKKVDAKEDVKKEENKKDEEIKAKKPVKKAKKSEESKEAETAEVIIDNGEEIKEEKQEDKANKTESKNNKVEETAKQEEREENEKAGEEALKSEN